MLQSNKYHYYNCPHIIVNISLSKIILILLVLILFISLLFIKLSVQMSLLLLLYAFLHKVHAKTSEVYMWHSYNIPVVHEHI